MSSEEESQEQAKKRIYTPPQHTDIQSDSYSDETDGNSDESKIQQKENRERIQLIIDSMNEEELLRYETFRRSGFQKNNIRKLVTSIIGQACNPNFIISISGVAKVFVGELVDAAKEVQDNWGDTGPLLPSHIHEAYRRLYNKMPNMKVFSKKPW
jgi:transcription initiation factor TFIID subunit 11